jgi:hypothetical protein
MSPKLKTMRDIITEKFAARDAKLLNDPTRAMEEVFDALESANKRIAEDAAVAYFSAYWQGVVERLMATAGMSRSVVLRQARLPPSPSHDPQAEKEEAEADGKPPRGWHSESFQKKVWAGLK